ncbi:hypothetical protein INQ45_10805 [Flavobacterium columnare]|uniref:hypothetical protein n=1 Tax=Flavobacterium columnare TaxID=996 RepID=UPI002D203B77|nr:hypothetical protein [Flavobacterium columnare]MEB3801521.1 hypothetical protein [Flavobacterium columnare]
MINKIEHNELVNKIFSEFQKTNKSKYTSLFISSLSSNNLNWRSGLSVLAIMQSFPNHEFTINNNSGINNEYLEKMSEKDRQFTISRIPCKFCSQYKSIELDFEFSEESFNELGGLISLNLVHLYYFLKEANKLNRIDPNNEDFRIFSDILDILLNAEPNENLKKSIVSSIKKIKGFKSNTEQIQCILETLGYCSILETQEQKGLLNQYINLATAPRKTHSSDWNYPVDFWLGKNGINKKAFSFWFGKYVELEKYYI